MMANTLMIRFVIIALQNRAPGQTACSQMVGFCESANIANFAMLHLRMWGHSCFFRGLVPRKGCLADQAGPLI